MRLTEILRVHEETILDDWEQAVRQSLSESARLDGENLRDDIPKFLDRLIKWLDGHSVQTSETVDKETTGAHARHRLEFGVSLDHLVHEFRLLRQTIMRHICEPDTQFDGPLSDLIRLNDAFDHAMAETVSTYVHERDAARDMLLAVLGHDLRNPLTAVKMGIQSLLEPKDQKGVRETAVRIGRAADRMQQMLSDLMDLVRSRFGVQMPMESTSGDLCEIARGTVDELQEAHPSRQLSFECRGETRGFWDHGRMGQLVSNLVANALQHGTDPITVELDGSEGFVSLCVTNRGAPISEERQRNLFKPFRTVAQGDARGNLGLGLFIVSEIVRRHGGRIDVTSTDEATAFSIRLPRISTAKN